MTDSTPPPPPPPQEQPPQPPSGGQYIPEGAPTGQIGKPRSKGLVILLAIVTLGIWTWVWSYQNGDEMKKYTGNGLGGTAYLIIMLLNIVFFGIPTIIVMFLIAGEVEQMYRRDGQDPPVTTLWGLWFLLPIIGQFVWYIRVQNSINNFWVQKGSTHQPGL